MADTGSSSSAALVSSLAQQLRSGAITKHQLFEKLAQLQQRGGPGGASQAAAPAAAAPRAAPRQAWTDDGASNTEQPYLDQQAQQELADRLAQQRLAAQSRRDSEDSLASSQQPVAHARVARNSQENENEAEAAASVQLAYVEAQQVRDDVGGGARSPGANKGPSTHNHNHNHDTSSSTSSSSHLYQHRGKGTQAPPQQQQHPPPPPQGESMMYESRRSGGGGGGGVRDSASHTSFGPRYSMDTTSTMYRTRPQDRLEQLEQELAEKEMAECTFRPKINELPAQYKQQQQHRARGRRKSAAAAVSSNNHDYTAIPFLDRVNKWQETRNKLTEAQRAEQENKELEGCTFAPAVRQSARLEKRLAKRQERLRRQSAAPAYGREEDMGRPPTRDKDPSVGIKASERLYEHAKMRREQLNQSRASAHYSAEHDIDENCTFKPKIRGDYKTEDGGTVSPRLYKPRRQAVVDDQPTFTPKVNKVKRNMGAARHYLAADPFERLSRPNIFSPQVVSASASASASAGGGGGGTEDGSSSIMRAGSLDSSATDDVYMTPASRRPDKDHGTHSHGHKHVHNIPEPPHTRSTKKGFNAFIDRQNKSARRKDAVSRRIVESEKEKATFKPKISKTSKQLMAASGSFMERLAKQQRQKENLTKFQEQQRKALDSDCTFKPKINRMSKQMGSRSDEQRSVGDAQKKEQLLAQLKARQSNNEMQEATFKPQLYTNNDGVRGKVRPDEDTQSYLQRLRQEENQAEARRRYIQAQREAEELEGCTFKPEIHDAPAYVKRIARSMQLSRGPQQPAKPERRWL